MRFRLAFVSGCVAVVAVNISGVAAAPDKPAASVESAAPAPLLKSGSAFSGYQSFGDEKLRSWKEANQEVADHPGMGSMGSMGSMKNMAGPESTSGVARTGKDGASGHDMGSMKGMTATSAPGMSKPAEAASHESHGEMAMAQPATAAGRGDRAPTAGVSGTATVLGVDKANARVKLAHDPIAALGWPKMTMFFRLKDGAFADRVKEGDRIEFSLEKSASGYLISDLKKSAPRR